MAREGRRSGGGFTPTPQAAGWKEHRGTVYRCEVHLSPAVGGFTAAAAALPGVTAHGATERDALDGVKQAIAAAMRGWKDAGTPFPWVRPAPPAPPGAAAHWVIARLQLTPGPRPAC